MILTLLFHIVLFNKVASQLLLSKNSINVPIGREVYIKTNDLLFANETVATVCKVEVINDEPMTQQVGVLIPQVFDCNFDSRTVKYIHHGSPLLSNDTVKLRAFMFAEHDTISEYFELLFIIKNTSYNVIQPLLPLTVKDFFGLTESIDDSVLNFNYSRKEGAVCKVKMSRHFSQRPAHGQIVIGREVRPIDVIKRKCDDFLQLGLRYEHLKPPSPNIDFILIVIEVSDPHLNNGDIISEWYQLPVIIEPGFPNLPPRASFSGMYLMDVDQFIITSITPTVLSATDSETPSNQLIFNISKPLLSHQGSIVHLSDHTRSIVSFKQSDLNNFNIAYKPPSRSFKERQMFEIGFVVRDLDFAFSELFTMHIAIRPAITIAPRISMNIGMVLLEGQSRPLRTNNLEIVDSDNIQGIKFFVTGGLHHGLLEVSGKPAVSFSQDDIVSESVIYHHDDSDSVRDSIHFRVSDGVHSSHIKFPISIIPKDDDCPLLVSNIGLKVKSKNEVQITSTFLRAVDHDTIDDRIKFVVLKSPTFGRIWKKLTWEKTGNVVFTFMQQDINKGLIYYHQDGKENSTDSFEVVLHDTNNPPNISPSYTILIQILPNGGDPPNRDPASSFEMTIHETDIGLFNSNNLHYMDIDSLDEEIVYFITTHPRFIGSFAFTDPGKIILYDELDLKQNVTPIFSFTQEQVNHQKVAYLPPSGEIGPNSLYLQFTFSVMDKDKNNVTGQVFNITILPVNNQVPQLHTSELLVEEGSSTLLSTNELSVYDPDTLSGDLQISLFTIPLYGSLCRSEQPLRVGDVLSLDDILTLRLEYIHDGSENFKDSFKVGVNDGLHFVSGDVKVSIEPVDDEKPIWRKDLLNQISVNEGGSVRLTPQILSATDIDTEDSALYFIITELPQFGNIVLDKQKVNRFTQKDVYEREVLYGHNNQEIGPNPKEDSLTVIVMDKMFPHQSPHNSHKLFITILPQNTQPPRLYFKRAILVEEGKRSTITDENLSATDDDTFPAELLIVMSKQPDYGYLENARPIPGYESNGKKKNITAFPLQDIKERYISFVQFNHRNIEPESDDFEVYITDGVHNSTSILVYVSIVLLNDEVPFFTLFNFTVEENAKYILDNRTIIGSDRDYPGDILILSVKQTPKFGSLTYFLQAINNGPLLEIPFNQLTLENFDSIVYHHDGTENYEDLFVLSLSDGMHSVERSCFVQIIPVNDEPPTLKTIFDAENVELFGNVILSNELLFAVDEDSSSNEVKYIVTKAATYGLLERYVSNKEWVPLENAEFSQEDINLKLIRYQNVHRPSSIFEDNYTFFLSDGLHKSSSHTFRIKLVDGKDSNLTVINREVLVEVGGETVLSSSMLFAFDNNSNVEEILFYVTNPPLYGNLVLNNSNSLFIGNFTGLHVLNNQLSYKHNKTFKISNDRFNVYSTRGEIKKYFTFHIQITSLPLPILTILLPLHFSISGSRSSVITSNLLLSHEPTLSATQIFYLIKEPPKHGHLVYNGNVINPKNFTQNDINNGLITYLTEFNVSQNDQFSFEVYNNKERGYMLDGRIIYEPAVFKIFGTSDTVKDPIVLISSPEVLENVHNQSGFLISSFNLKVLHTSAAIYDIKFYPLKHRQIFHLGENMFVQMFTQKDIDEHYIAIILQNQTITNDSFIFKIGIHNISYEQEYRMEIHWSIVYFPHAEYSACEDVGYLNIVIKRSGNLNVSSSVTISTVDQTAKEGIDFVSERIRKIQFNFGMEELTWKITIIKDDLEEAPIEQFQLILSQPENCIIPDHNKTIISIYDLNRDSCSYIPIRTANQYKTDVDSDFTDKVKECHQNGSKLQTPYECDRKEWTLSSTEQNLLLQDNLITEISQTTLNTKESKPDTERCSRGWQKFGKMCYKFHRPPSLWSSAKIICNGYPFGQLVLVESSEHNSWLLQLARNRPFWIGLSSVDDDWPNYSSFTNWKKGFPRSSGETVNQCVFVRGSGSWINKNCENHEHSFICSKHLE